MPKLSKPLYRIEADGRVLYDWEAIVNQDRVWIDRHGVEHAIAEMDDEYRAHALAFLVRNHGMRLWSEARQNYLTYSPPRDEMAQDAFEAEMDEFFRSSPERFIREWTPLGEALAQ